MITPKNHKDKASLSALNISSAIELALEAPAGYDDFTISKFPKIGDFNTVEVNIKSIQKYPKYLKATALAWSKTVELVIFNPKPFHLLTFKVGNSLYVKAKAENGAGAIQLIQPKAAKFINKIVPIYKNSAIQRLIKEYLTEEELVNEGIPSPLASTLFALHNPSQPYKEALQKSIYSLKFAEIYLFLQRLSSKKEIYKASSTLIGDEKEFIKTLPFTLTNDQKRAVADIKEDLKKENAARRVIMGDVGSGKTVVIFAAVMMAFPKRSILMVPTTILASQIWSEAKRLLPPKIKILLVEGKEQNLEEADFIIGTHVLLYRNLPKCDLVMVDEQHRFGTAQRNTIHKLASSDKTHPHFLQFSATPIPRTMSLIHSCLVNYSFIKETPFEKKITTLIIDKSGFGKMLGHIQNEIQNGRQIVIVYPIVEENKNYNYQSIDEGRSFWEKRFKDVYVTHGRDKDKEKILKEFSQSGSILLSTTVVEVGISLPKLSTIVIVGAERLGLAALHQLRGRVSRVGLEGYCFLYTNEIKNMRLSEFAKTKSGFDIAELDLKYRQSGDILSGILQHGVQFKWFKNDKEILLSVQKLQCSQNIV